MPKGVKGFQKGHKLNVGEKSPFWKGGKARFPKCKECSKQLTRNDAKLCKRCCSKGKRHWNWKGGRWLSADNKVRKSLEYKLWRKAVFERDNYTCIWCGAKSGNGKAVILHADHIKPFAIFPELRFAIDNGRTLCLDCHKTTDTFAGKLKVKKIIKKKKK